ncbi:MAG: hypothetical protein WC342_08730 [Methanoregula sp.]
MKSESMAGAAAPALIVPDMPATVPQVPGPVTPPDCKTSAQIIPGSSRSDLRAGPEVYTRCNAVIIDAMRIAECTGHLPVLVRKAKIPVDMIAIGQNESYIVEVVRSRNPLPDAKTVLASCRNEIDYLREIRCSSQFRKMLWVYSPQCLWRFYDVFPGGIWLAKDLMEWDKK